MSVEKNFDNENVGYLAVTLDKEKGQPHECSVEKEEQTSIIVSYPSFLS
jgi:hypothetical protein